MAAVTLQGQSQVAVIETIWPQSLKCLLSDPLQEKFAYSKARVPKTLKTSKKNVDFMH
jgi:hypothetical protein